MKTIKKEKIWVTLSCILLMGSMFSYTTIALVYNISEWLSMLVFIPFLIGFLMIYVYAESKIRKPREEV